MANAFMTGSRRYGTPRKSSDLDIVVLVSPAEFPLLAKVATALASQVKGKPETYNTLATNDEPKKGDEGGELNLRFGKLNLIVFTSQAKFEAWQIATRILETEAPVTRDRAIDVIDLLCKAV